MTRIGIALASASCVLVLSTTACGGSSHNESTASVCAKIKKDAMSLTNANPSDAMQAAADLNKAASTLKSDAADAKDSNVRNTVDKASSALTSLGGQLSSGTLTASKATQLETQLKNAGTQLNSVCPGATPTS